MKEKTKKTLYVRPEIKMIPMDGFELMAASGEDPERIVDERGMRQVNDTDALQATVDEVLARCSDQAQQYRDGNQKVIGFLVGQCMKASKGKGNPALLREILQKRLGFSSEKGDNVVKQSCSQTEIADHTAGNHQGNEVRQIGDGLSGSLKRLVLHFIQK